MKLTRISSDSGMLTKAISLSDGKIEKIPHCSLTKGTAEKIEVSAFGELLSVVVNLNANQAVIHTPFLHELDHVEVLASKSLNGQPNTIARTKRFFQYSVEACPVSFDYDLSERIDPETWLTRMCGVWQAFEGAGFAYVASSSGGLTSLTGELIQGSTGMRFLFGVQDASDIPRFSHALFVRCCLSGHLSIFVSRTGELYPRTLFDAAVHSPERLDLLADAQLGDGLRQDRRARSREGALLDTRSFPDLAAAELDEYAQLVTATKKNYYEKSAEARKQYLERHAGSESTKRKIVMSRLKKKLLGSDVLRFDELGEVRVADLLMDRKKYSEETLHDPLEPERGPNKAICYWNAETDAVSIYSHIHGGILYECKYDGTTAMQAYEARSDKCEFADIARDADFEPVEEEQFRKQVRRHTQLSLRVIGDQIQADLGVTKAKTHHEMAVDYTSATGLLKYADGDLWLCDQRNIFSKVTDYAVQATTGAMFPSEPLAKTQSHYSQITKQVHNINCDEDFFSSAPVGIACPGGFYYLDDHGELQREELRSTHRQRFFLPADPDDSDPLMWNDFLHECFTEPNDAYRLAEEYIWDPVGQSLRLQELFGAVLFGIGHQLEQAWYVLGEANSGKSTMLRVLESLIPDEFICSVPPSLWGQPYHSAARAGMRLIAVGETENDLLGADFKSYIGRDRQNARHPCGRPFSFKPTATCVFNANDFPPLKDRSTAMWRRIQCLGFFNSRVVLSLPSIPDLDNQLINEKPQIISWAIEGAKRLRKNNRYTESPVDNLLKSQWKTDADTIQQFLNDDDWITLHASRRSNRARVYDSYGFWCRRSNYKALSRKKFVKEMGRLGHYAKKMDGYWQYHGVGIVERDGE